MTTLDPQAVTAAVFARLKSDADAAPVALRAALGQGAACVLDAQALRAKEPGQLPLRPLVALREGVITGETLDMRDFIYTWWLYDDPQHKGYRIRALVRLIEAAYTRWCIPYGRVRVTGIGQQTVDDALGGLVVRSMQLTYTRRA